VKRVVRPLLGFTSFWAARCTIAGIEVMHAIRKGQLLIPEHAPQMPAEQFYALAAQLTGSDAFARPPAKVCDKTPNRCHATLLTA